MNSPELRINPLMICNDSKALEILNARPEIMEDVCLVLANGGSLITCAQKLGIPYSRLAVWLNDSEDKRKRIRLAMEARDEWLVHRISQELQDMGLLNTREIYNDDGTLKAIRDIPDHVLKCVQGIDVIETSGKDGTVSQIKRLRFTDKQKALEMLGRNLEKFMERKQIDVGVSYKIEEFDITERLKIYDVPVAELVAQAEVKPVVRDEGVAI